MKDGVVDDIRGGRDRYLGFEACDDGFEFGG